jgi:uncharacterized protein (TIGR02246 family)
MDNPSSFRCKEDCAALFTAYANSVDFRDYDRVVSLFAPDGVMIRNGTPRKGAAAIMEAMEARALNTAIRHVISNTEITQSSAETATGMCYFIAFIEPGADNATNLQMHGPAVMGEIHGEFRLTDMGWKFQHFYPRLTFVRDPN